MNTKDLRDMSVDELRGREKELSTELFNLRFQMETNQLENPMRLRETRKDLARVKTLIGQMQARGGK